MSLGPQAFYQAFRGYSDIVDRVRALVRASAGTAELVELWPATHEGRKILAVRLRGAGYQPGGPRALFTFALHAREWLTSMSGVYAVEETIARAKADPDWLNQTEVVIVPLANPDGFVYSGTRDRWWRKNRRPNLFSLAPAGAVPTARNGDPCSGVDLNRNFGFQWAESLEKDLCGDIYAGTGPASEPETQALQHLVEESTLSVHVDFHSCGGLVLGPWSYTPVIPHPRKREVTSFGEKMLSAIAGRHGERFRFCTGNVCLYPVHGVFTDFTGSRGALSLTIESRPITSAVRMADFAPPEDQILPHCEENFAAVLTAISTAQEQRV